MTPDQKIIHDYSNAYFAYNGRRPNLFISHKNRTCRIGNPNEEAHCIEDMVIFTENLNKSGGSLRKPDEDFYKNLNRVNIYMSLLRKLTPITIQEIC